MRSNNIQMTDISPGNAAEVKDPTTFTYGLTSAYVKQQQQERINKHLTQLKVFNEIVTKTETPFTDPAGNRITNATTENLWFRNNVAMIFSMGAIFSEADQHKLSEILQMFQQTDETGKIASARTDNAAFLLNAYKVSNYHDPFIKALEQRLEIGNGNYHICVIPIVTTEDVNILKHAPEECYKYAGPVDKYCEWDAVFRERPYDKDGHGRLGQRCGQRRTGCAPTECADKEQVESNVGTAGNHDAAERRLTVTHAAQYR